MVIKISAQNNGQQDFPAVRFVFIFINTSLSEKVAAVDDLFGLPA